MFTLFSWYRNISIGTGSLLCSNEYSKILTIRFLYKLFYTKWVCVMENESVSKIATNLSFDDTFVICVFAWTLHLFQLFYGCESALLNWRLYSASKYWINIEHVWISFDVNWAMEKMHWFFIASDIFRMNVMDEQYFSISHNIVWFRLIFCIRFTGFLITKLMSLCVCVTKNRLLVAASLIRSMSYCLNIKSIYRRARMNESVTWCV